MCEFCVKHGDGRKWYLQAKNYSEDLLSDLRRRKYIVDFMTDVDGARRDLHRLERLDGAPEFVQRVVKGGLSKFHFKKNHFGQVLPIEDIEQILKFVNSVVRVPCYCRHVVHNSEHRYCYGLSMGPNGGKMAELIEGLHDSFLTGPESGGVEQVSKEDALTQMRKMERQGLCHTVWTFRTPFIGGICNCDRSDCLAMTATVTHQFKVMFRAEYVAEGDLDRCNGCRQCMRVCQFGAIHYSAALNKTSIDPSRCYGCGICRAMCKKKAIRIVDRHASPKTATLW